MNLLLFLSALLSALTGVVGGGRVAEVPQYEAALAATVRVAVAPAAISSRPTQHLPGIGDVQAMPRGASTFLVAPTRPLFAGRRRE